MGRVKKLPKQYRKRVAALRRRGVSNEKALQHVLHEWWLSIRDHDDDESPALKAWRRATRRRNR